jgi:Flp pilus assembly protein TadG
VKARTTSRPKAPPSRSARRGTTLVETTIVLSAFLVFLFAIFDFGRIVMMRHLVDNAAREGARQATTNTATLATSDIQSTVTKYLAGQTLSGLSIQVYKADPATGNNIGLWTDAQFGDCIAVDVSGSYKTLFPGLGWLPSAVTIHTKSLMHSEAN